MSKTVSPPRELIRSHLENEKHRLDAEIKNYPTPIPACDAQFNYLLEERAKIAEEIRRLEQTRRIDVFFYGLFMDEELLRDKGMDPRDRRLASLENFALVIGERATLVPSPGQMVHGVVFSLTVDEVEALYSDASVSEYGPESVTARLTNNQPFQALCFNLPAAPAADHRNPQYVAKLRELAARIGLRPEYVNSIR